MNSRGTTASYFVLSATLLALSSCGGGTNSDTRVAIDAGQSESDSSPRADASAIDTNKGPACLSARTPVSLNEVMPLGFAPSEVMALLGPPRSAELRFRDVAGDGLKRVPSTTSTTIRVTSEFDSARSFFVDLAPNPDSPPPSGVLCKDYLLLGVRFTLTSDDGAFDEILEAEVVVSHLSDRLTSTVSLRAEAMRGTFALSTTTGIGQFVYSFRQTFSAGAWIGRVDASNGLKSYLEEPPFAEWGSAPCAAGSTPILQDGSTRAALAAQAIDTITNAPVSLSFSDGTRAIAHLSYGASPLACQVEDRQYLSEPEGTILLPGPITVVTDDGRWSATLGATGVGSVAASALSRLRVYYNGTQTLPPAAFTTFYGFTGVDFTNHAKARLTFSVDYDPVSQSASGGYFGIWGVFSETSALGSTILEATVGGIQ